MLHIRSFRDFPDAFDGGNELALLSARELELFAALKGRPAEQLRWLRGRLTVKELCQRYAITTWGQSLAGTDITILQRTELAPYIDFEVGARSVVRGPIGVHLAHVDRYTAAVVRAAVPGHTFAVGLERIEPRFPFFADDMFTDSERDLLRNHDQATADRMLSAYWALKQAAASALNVDKTHAGHHVEVCAVPVGGNASLRCTTKNGMVLGPSQIRARYWFFDHHVLAFVALWCPPANPPHVLEKVEEEPVLPEQRFDTRTV